MKNIFRFLMSAAILFGAVSCAKEDISSSLAGGEVEVTLSVDVPELGTRAYGDGMTVNQLFIAVYEQGGTKALPISHIGGTGFQDSEDFSGGRATVTMVLLKDKTYDLVFWAQKSGTGAYDVNLANGRNIEANYGALCNLEDRDAFFFIRNNWTAGAQGAETEFKLNRPFAQINVANSNADVDFVTANGATIVTSAMTVNTKVANVLDMKTGDVKGSVDVAFAANAIPTEKFHIAGYNYLAMNYLLVKDKELVNLEFVFTDDNDVKYTREYFAVPVQRNYRTNILGQIISSPIDFTVVIDPIFKGESEVDAETQIFDVHNQTEFEDALEKAAGQNHIQHLVINLYSNVTLDINAREALAIGNKNTKDITIDGSKSRAADDCYTLTFNNLNSDWSNIATNGAKLILNNLNLSNSGKNDGPWNRHDLNFVCDVEMNNVVSDKAIAVAANATLNRVTISDVHPNNSEAYALWIRPNGQTVTLDNCTIVCHSSKTTDRGIKIDNQYLDDAKKVILNVSKTSFTTQKKAAILVNTPAGAEINLENIDITRVAADSTNAVWVDEKAQAYADLVTVTGGTMIIEGFTPVSTADELVAALAKGEGVYLLNDITVAATDGGYKKAGILQNKAQTIDGGGHTLTVTGANETWSCAIYTNGGIIRNLTVAGAMRGIFTAGQSADLHIENVEFKNVVYTFNSDGKMPTNPFGVYVSNSKVNGWTSHSDMHTEVVYTDCTFGEGSGYAYCRPYGTTKFVDCTFCAGYTIDKSQTNDITFENCTFEE